MKKNLILLLLLVLLSVGVYIAFSNSEEEKITSLKAERDFAVKDPSIIHKIFIADRSGVTTTLVRKKGYWTYNDKYRARDNAMDNLLEVIEKVDIKYIPPNAALSNITKELTVNGVKVELYDVNDNIIKTYYVGGMTNDETGTHFIMDGSDQPFVMHIPHLRAGLKYRYLMKSDNWKDKHIFRAKYDDIEYLKVVYPHQQLKSFVIEKKNANYLVTSPFDESIHKEVSNSKAGQYLEAFEAKMAEKWMNDYPPKDSVRALIPFAIINIKKKGEEEKAVRFIPLGSQADKNYILKYFADCSWGDFFTVQHNVFADVFASIDFFIPLKEE